MGVFLIIWKKYKSLIVFLFLELVAMGLLFSYNSYQNSYLFQTTTAIRSDFFATLSSVDEYFRLEIDNERLLEENRKLTEQIKNTRIIDTTKAIAVLDKYEYQTAKVSYGTVGLPENYLILNKGRKDGITPELAVLSPVGLVGIVYDVTDDYASVMPLINTSFSCLVSIGNHTLTASTSWDGKDYRFIEVKGVPLHLSVKQNDSIFTNRNSTLYPPDELIGTVTAIRKEDLGRSYALRVKLATDFTTVRTVYVVRNKDKQQLDSLLNNE